MRLNPAALALDNEEDLIEKPSESALMRMGKIFKKKRSLMKLTLDDVSKETCIRKFYLEGLEKGLSDRLPPLSYTLGFMRSYAKLLDENVDALIEEFKEEVGVERLTPHLYTVHESRQKSFWQKYFFNFKTVVFFSVIGCVKLYILWFLVSPLATSNDSAPLEQPQKPEEFAQNYGLALPEASSSVEPVLAVPSPESDVSSQEEAAAPLVPALQENGKITIKAIEDCWIQTNAGEKVVFQGLLKAGQVYDVPQEKGLTLTVGNAPVLEIAVDGKVLNRFDAQNRVLRNVALEPQTLVQQLGLHH